MASTRRYQIPVMDSIFVRKNQRSQGLGLEMLQDFVLSFKENALGLRYPLPTSMYKGNSFKWLIDISHQFVSVTFHTLIVINKCFYVSIMVLFLIPVCKKYLCQYPGDEGLLWEVESVGEPYQRTNLSRKIHSMDLSGKTNKTKLVNCLKYLQLQYNSRCLI